MLCYLRDPQPFCHGRGHLVSVPAETFGVYRLYTALPVVAALTLAALTPLRVVAALVAALEALESALEPPRLGTCQRCG